MSIFLDKTTKRKQQGKLVERSFKSESIPESFSHQIKKVKITTLPNTQQDNSLNQQNHYQFFGQKKEKTKPDWAQDIFTPQNETDIQYEKSEEVNLSKKEGSMEAHSTLEGEINKLNLRDQKNNSLFEEKKIKIPRQDKVGDKKRVEDPEAEFDFGKIVSDEKESEMEQVSPDFDLDKSEEDNTLRPASNWDVLGSLKEDLEKLEKLPADRWNEWISKLHERGKIRLTTIRSPLEGKYRSIYVKDFYSMLLQEHILRMELISQESSNIGLEILYGIEVPSLEALQGENIAKHLSRTLLVGVYDKKEIESSNGEEEVESLNDEEETEPPLKPIFFIKVMFKSFQDELEFLKTCFWTLMQESPWKQPVYGILVNSLEITFMEIDFNEEELNFKYSQSFTVDLTQEFNDKKKEPSDELKSVFKLLISMIIKSIRENKPESGEV